jgi:hypothetical protein
VQWSLVNTPQNLKRGKARTRYGGRAAFAKLGSAVLLELGLHNPVAAAVGRHGQSEWALAVGLLAHLPKQSLLLADRLYGCASFVAAVLDRQRQVGGHFLVRVRDQFSARVVRRLRDGSTVVEVPLRDRKVPKNIVRRLRLRQIVVRVGRKGFRTQRLRLWTSLLDARQAPALELAQLYAQRWEEELYFRQIKLDLRKSDLLQSQTPETAAQEVAAIIICSALVAQSRAQAAAGQVPVLRISFCKTVELLRPLWLILALGGDLLGPTAQAELVKRVMEYLRQTMSRPRRSRSCLRAVRQNAKPWPRITKPVSREVAISFRILRA